MKQPIIKQIETKNVLTKSNLLVSDYSVNTYVGCTHACKYCYASFMKHFTNHPELWGDFLDVKLWPAIKNPQKYVGKELFSVLLPTRTIHRKKPIGGQERFSRNYRAVKLNSAYRPNQTWFCGIWSS